jgi:hypothetical protein
VVERNGETERERGREGERDSTRASNQEEKETGREIKGSREKNRALAHARANLKFSVCVGHSAAVLTSLEHIFSTNPLFHRLFDASPDSDIPKNVSITLVINTHITVFRTGPGVLTVTRP